MSGETLIAKQQLQSVVEANKKVLNVAAELLSLSKDDPVLRDKLRPAIKTLVESGTYVNTAIHSVSGTAAKPGA